MREPRSRRWHVPERVLARAWLCGLLLLTVPVGIAVAALSADRPHPSASAPARLVAPAGSVAPVNSTAGGPGAPAAAVAPGAGPALIPAAPARRVQTMSMYTRIQGGLTAHQEQVISARMIGSHTDAATAPSSTYWTPAAGRSAVARAESWLGMPYSWAGGSATGPTAGQCVRGDGGDLDCHIVGFDCSGLAMYAWGPYLSLPHLAAEQYGAGGFHPSIAQLLPGDLVFFSAYLPGGIGHVAIYAGEGRVIEAPQSGAVVHWASLSDLIAEDGTYRGAVRPLTTATPTVTTPATAVPAGGATITLHGTNLAAVDAVHLGTGVITSFAQHTDTSLVLALPAHRAGPMALTVSTPWSARSAPVTLRYAAARPSPSSSSPTAPTSGTPSAPPTSTPAPPSTPPSSSGAPPSSGTPSAPPTSNPAPPSTPPSSSPSPNPSPSPSRSPSAAPAAATP